MRPRRQGEAAAATLVDEHAQWIASLFADFTPDEMLLSALLEKAWRKTDRVRYERRHRRHRPCAPGPAERGQRGQRHPDGRAGHRFRPVAVRRRAGNRRRPPGADASALEAAGITNRMASAAQLLLEANVDLAQLQAHASDTVRGWACLPSPPNLVDLAATADGHAAALADDGHFGVREWASAGAAAPSGGAS